MQPGFAMLEAGSTGSTAITSILFKNFTDCLVGAIGWFSLGFAFAFGHSHNQFIGDEGFFTYKVGKCNYAFWFFQLSFATTASTIVSGAIAGRTKVRSAASPPHRGATLDCGIISLRQHAYIACFQNA